MARRFFIPFISLLTATGIGYALQAHQPSRKDFIAWTAFATLVIGGFDLISGLVLLLTPAKKLAKEFLLTALILLLAGGCIVGYMYWRGDFEKLNL